MKSGKFLIPSALLFCAAGIALGQGPMYDKVIVDLPYSVTIQDKTLPPGEYIIRQNPTAGNPHNVLIYSNGGTQFETSSVTIPTLDNRTPNDTRVMLHRFGNDYYFDKIWVQGKNYGYEFPLPASVRARERERAQSVSVAANYEAVQEQQQARTETQPQPEIAQNTPPPAPEAPAPAPEAQPEPAPAPVAEAPAPAPAPMPRTDANWLGMLLGGGLLSGAGLLLRRR
jgi:hypothetical protein